MSKERFLLYMLAGIFTFQAGMLSYGVYYCGQTVVDYNRVLN